MIWGYRYFWKHPYTNLPLRKQPFMDRLFFAGSPSRPSFGPLVYRILYMDHSGDSWMYPYQRTMGNLYISPFLWAVLVEYNDPQESRKNHPKDFQGIPFPWILSMGFLPSLRDFFGRADFRNPWSSVKIREKSWAHNISENLGKDSGCME